MSRACPVISTIVAGNDPVADAQCGFSVAGDVNKTTVHLLREWLQCSDQSLKVLGQNGLKWVTEHHDYTQLAARYESLLRE